MITMINKATSATVATRISGIMSILFVVIFLINFFKFDSSSFDTYYIWSSIYFLGTILFLSLLFGLYFAILKLAVNANKKIKLGIFYTNFIISIVGVVLLLIFNQLIENYNFQIKDYSVFNEIEISQNNDWLYIMINYSCLCLLIIQVIMVLVLIVSFAKK